jgi:molybdate transport system substrate-binding protein
MSATPDAKPSMLGSALRAATVLAAMTMPATAQAAELKVISAGAARGVLGGMIDDYSRQTGIEVTFTAGPTGMLRKTITSGEPADLVITSAPLMAELESSGKIVPGSRIDLGRVGLGVVVREGTPSPDISTPDAVKAVLLNAKSIAYTDPKLGGTSVEHLMKFAEGMGIKDEVLRKGLTATGGNDAAAKVADGRADVAIVPITDIHAKAAKLVGPLPEAIQLWTVYAAAIPKSSSDPESARAFVKVLTGPSMRDRWTKAGWQPVK